MVYTKPLKPSLDFERHVDCLPHPGRQKDSVKCCRDQTLFLKAHRDTKFCQRPLPAASLLQRPTFPFSPLLREVDRDSSGCSLGQSMHIGLPCGRSELISMFVVEAGERPFISHVNSDVLKLFFDVKVEKGLLLSLFCLYLCPYCTYTV